ncbi:MAG TPA: peptidylprolyl isomerase, partial [Longimicrobiales bacterium]
ARVALTGGAVEARSAVFALGRIGTKAAFDDVLAVLANGEPGIRQPSTTLFSASAPGEPRPLPRPTEVAGQALLTIWRFRRTPMSAGGPLAFAASPDTALRWRAAYALMRLADPRTVPDLERLLSDPYAEVRALAARGLRASLTDSAGRRAEARTRLVAALQDSAPHVRINAAGALGTYHDSVLVDPLRALLRDRDVNVAIAAAQALGTLRHPDGTVPLGELFAQREAPLPLRAAALAALARLDGALAMSAAEAWAEDTGAVAWRQRFYAASGLAAARWNLAGSTLQKLARDRDGRVAAAALDAMGSLLGDSIAPPRALLVEKLGAADIMVRASAMRVLSAKPQAADLALFLDSYARAADDSLDDAALAAVDALEALKKTGAPAAHDFFARFQRSQDPIVRRAVSDKLGEGWGAVAPVQTGRDSAFYLDVVRRLVAPALAARPRTSGPRVRVTVAVGTPARDTAFVLELDGAEAPLTVDNFLKLARMHYFDGAHWHRVVPKFVVQDGDPRGDGNGGPGWAIRDELNDLPYLRGALGMALSGPDTGGSQWFLTLSPQPHLDAGYTLFGHVLRGMDVIDLVTQDDIIRSVEVIP